MNPATKAVFNSHNVIFTVTATRIWDLAISFSWESCQRFLRHHSVDCEGRKRQCLGVLETHVFPYPSPAIQRHTCGRYPWWEGVVRYMFHAECSPFPRRGSDPAFPAVCWCDFNSDLSERLTHGYARSIRVKPPNSHAARFVLLAPSRVSETRAIHGVLSCLMTSRIIVGGYQYFGGTYWSHLQSWNPIAWLHVVVTRKTWIFTAVKASSLTLCD